MLDATLKATYDAYLKVKNCKACSGRRKRLKATLDTLLKRLGITEDELLKQVEKES